MPLVDHPEGWARVETWTIKHGKDRRHTAVVIADVPPAAARP